MCRISWPHTGGMEAVVGGLSAALVARGHDIEVLTLDRAITDGSSLPAGEVEGVRYRRLRRIGPRRYPFALGLNRALAGFDIAHVHGIDGLADTAVTGRHGARVGISTHGGYFHTRRNRWIKELALRTVTRRTLQRAHAVWYTSESDRSALAAAGVTGDVVHNGVDVARFSDVKRDPEPGRWLVFGRVDVHKGIDRLIDAIALLDRGVLEVVGPESAPGLVRNLRRRARDAGVGDRVRFHGSVEEKDLRELIGACELALFPSRYEGFGLTTVELMAAGMPVVASRIEAFENLVRHGEDGWLVDFGDAGATAGLLRDLVGGKHDGIASAGAAAGRAYGWERQVVNWESAYEALLR